MNSHAIYPSLPAPFSARPATLDDVEAVVELINACAIDLTGELRALAHDVRSDWQQPEFNPETDTLIVLTPEGGIVGHAEMWDRAPFVRLYVIVEVHPKYAGRGIGTALCRWAEGRARRSIPQAPSGARVVLQQSVLSTDGATQELLRQQAYRVVRHSLRMRIDMDELPPEPAVPAGLIIRPFVRERESRALVLAIREAFHDHWGFVEWSLEEHYRAWMHYLDTNPDVDPSLWFVAVDERTGEIAGVSLCHPAVAQDPDMGQVETLGVRRRWRRRGLGLALLRHSFRALYRRGKRKVSLGVDADSLTGATRLYEKAGMHVYRQYVEYEKELRPGEELSTQAVVD
jgi:mycothiol synthase